MDGFAIAAGLDVASIPALREIFFLSSTTKDFADGGEMEMFFNVWTSYYFEHEPELVYTISANGSPGGYLTGCADSARAAPWFARTESYPLFSDWFHEYPAHFHINVHPRLRGQGLGSRLARRFFDDMKRRGAAGVHVVTAADARNTGFYQRLGLAPLARRECGGRRLAALGQRW
ncbi:MAG: GNAT family N-acetyltransferase [Nitrospinae bacterium]|nr:GNAT family N-acetyltransferase [Nitrospinota bacterium]